MNRARCLAAVCSIAGVIALRVGAAESDIAKLAWLAGCWQDESAEAGSVEQWTALAGGTMLGVSRTVRGGETALYEFMQLRSLADGTLVFVAAPSGQPEAAFPAVRVNANEAVFENPSHDFPQRVVYARDGDAKLRARIEGTIEGETRVVVFTMRRVSCDALAAAPRG